MKRLATYLLVGTLCFFVSLSAYKLWTDFRSSPRVDGHLSVSICELDRDPKRYEGKVVVVKGVLHGDLGGNPYIADEFCGSQSSFGEIRVSVEADQVYSRLPGWASYASFCGNDTYAAIVDGLSADVVITGTFEQSRIIPMRVLQLASPTRQR
jgi:hypothetical protein